jgi:hypothetical protein
MVSVIFTGTVIWQLAPAFKKPPVSVKLVEVYEMLPPHVLVIAGVGSTVIEPGALMVRKLSVNCRLAAPPADWFAIVSTKLVVPPATRVLGTKVFVPARSAEPTSGTLPVPWKVGNPAPKEPLAMLLL